MIAKRIATALILASYFGSALFKPVMVFISHRNYDLYCLMGILQAD